MDFNEKDVYYRMSKSIIDRYNDMSGGIEGNLSSYTEEISRAGSALGMESFLDFLNSDKCKFETKEEIAFALQQNINMIVSLYVIEKNNFKEI